MRAIGGRAMAVWRAARHRAAAALQLLASGAVVGAVLILAGCTAAVAGVYLLLGLGFALLAGAVPLLAIGVLILRGAFDGE